VTEPGYARYLRDVCKFSLLTQAQEQALARRWRDYGDLHAMQCLVSSHLRLVVKLAQSYRGYCRPLADIVAEGNIGLLQAVKRFDPDRGCRLATYSVSWIRAVIMEYVMRTWSLVRIGTTGPQRKLF
jgi:RNA polymerase sigma-32 factor